MKQIVTIISLALTMYCSCTKNSNIPNKPIGKDTRCINQLFRDKNQLLVSTSDYDTAISLFKLNNINYDNLQINSVKKGVDIYGDYISVWASEYVNSLEVFNGGVTYYFRQDGSLSYNVGYQYAENNSQIDTLPALKLTQVRKLWTDALNTYYNGAYSNYQDSCVSATFGYIDTAYNTSQGNNKLVKVWFVTTANRSPLYAVFYDSDGKTYTFGNGILE